MILLYLWLSFIIGFILGMRFVSRVENTVSTEDLERELRDRRLAQEWLKGE